MWAAGYSYCFSHAALRPNIVKTAMQASGSVASAFFKLLEKISASKSVLLWHSPSDLDD